MKYSKSLYDLDHLIKDHYFWELPFYKEPYIYATYFRIPFEIEFRYYFNE